MAECIDDSRDILGIYIALGQSCSDLAFLFFRDGLLLVIAAQYFVYSFLGGTQTLVFSLVARHYPYWLELYDDLCRY